MGICIPFFVKKMYLCGGRKNFYRYERVTYWHTDVFGNNQPKYGIC